MKNKPLKIDMCAGSELKDTQGETLSIEGADISELEAGRGRLNDDHGKGFFNSLGKITEAKKIFKSEDCTNARHTYYWEKIKAPYIYVAGELYDNEDHPNARAAAAILRNIHREDVPLKLKASVEGGVMSRGISDPSRLAQTKIHSVALTFTPANTATLVEPLNLDKSSQDWEADRQLIKSVIHLAETNIPSFRHIERHASANTIIENINKIKELAKTVGLDIQVSSSTPEAILKQTAANKIEQNIKKINELVKAIDPKSGLAAKLPRVDAAREARALKEQETKGIAVDKYQQGIGKLKNAAAASDGAPITSAATPKTETAPIKTGSQFQQDLDAKLAERQAARDTMNPAQFNAQQAPTPPATPPVTPPKPSGPPNLSIVRADPFQEHANKAMLDVGHLKNVHSDLIAKGIDPLKAQQVIDKIRSYMDIKKSERHHKIKNNLIKVMTAGFGGAGSPGSLTGGGVFQSESLESPRRTGGMKYITCDNCGDEQVHMKHQVKCRKCGRNFNFDKLKDLL